VEWPEKAEALLPRCDLRLTLVPDEQSAARDLRIEALSPRGEELLA
jgi:tRNA A37 threonylcarbamoyladenosine biosynthesis protein TsaE